MKTDDIEFFRLSKKSLCLLREVVNKRRQGLKWIIEDTANLKEVYPDDLKETLCQLITDEFCETGLNDDDEPNERGLALESLIDEVRRKI